MKDGRQQNDGQMFGRHTRMLQMHRGSDGKWFLVAMVGMEQFRAFCNKVIERPDFLTDDRTYQTEKNVAAREAFRADIAKIMATKPRQYWLDKCDAAGKVPCAPCSTYEEVGDAESIVGMHLGILIQTIKGGAGGTVFNSSTIPIIVMGLRPGLVIVTVHHFHSNDTPLS